MWALLGLAIPAGMWFCARRVAALLTFVYDVWWKEDTEGFS